MSQLSKFKIVFLGDPSVGKTSILARFINDTFEDHYQPTIGIDFLSKTIYLDDQTVRLQLWDTAGQERFRALIPGYLRDSSAAIVVYDITSRQSFEHIEGWVNDVRSERGEEAVIMIVGNKADMSESRQVQTEEAEEKAQKLGCLFSEASAKAGYNVKSLFRKVALTLPSANQNNRDNPQQLEPDAPPSSGLVNPSEKKQEGKGCGC
ncbi:putative GTP-binding protein YPT6 [Blattamonas nauphoetae]|uniref:GTP-binding protein YPT6 n=1 Tax=Blattamonas nauphoetae TaxID=2049346 RepID=A0ABQ9YHF3_9EUKA|nr:putative GTP-binding protein YPT6 [Blattamonas nauphoetae]